jgi:hypothetical protein
MTRLKSFLVIVFIGSVAAFVSQTGRVVDRTGEGVQRSICEGLRASGYDSAPGCSASNSQSFGSRDKIVARDSHDKIAAKNIFLIGAALFKCNNFTVVAARVAEYARQNGVNTESIKKDDGKYEDQKRYAIGIVNSHAEINTGSLCAAIIQDFGLRGTLAAGLVAEKQ